MTPAQRLVLGIGLNKTGTTSLHEALEVLGYRSLHWGGPDARSRVRRAIEEGKPMLHYLDAGLEAVSDLEEVTYNFDLADRQYPETRFVLTVRDIDDWVESRRRHVELNRRARRAGRYSGSFLEIDPAAWIADYRRHVARVRAHFADRPGDLLVMDIADGDGWDPLCAFLGEPVPDCPFPARNAYRRWKGTRRRGVAQPPGPGSAARSAQSTE